MKKLAVWMLALAIVMSGTAVARADGVDVKVSGEWDFVFGWVDNAVFKDSVHNDAGRVDDDNVFARQRIRTQVNFIASEHLQGVLMFEIGDLDWGRGYYNSGGASRSGQGSGGGLDTDGVNIETKRAYLDWIIPNTKLAVRMGLQGVALPSTPMGSPLLDTDAGGIVLSYPITDWLAASAFWLRPFDAYANDANNNLGFGQSHLSDDVDLFGLLLPLEGAGWKVTPWGMYGFVGANSGFYDYLFTVEGENTVTAENSHAKAWWTGLHMEITALDPLVFNFETIYGSLRRANLRGLVNSEEYAGDTNIGTSGWYMAATLDYTLDWGTPGLLGWYATGDDANADHSGRLGRLPMLGADPVFAPTSFGAAGTFSIGADSVITATATGTWGVGIQLAEVSFIEDLKHTLRLAYYRGTNDADLVKKNGESNYLKYGLDGLYLTDKDSVIEVNFDHSYQLYENLVTIVELGYIHLNADQDTWEHKSGSGLDEKENAWKAQVLFQYSF